MANNTTQPVIDVTDAAKQLKNDFVSAIDDYEKNYRSQLIKRGLAARKAYLAIQSKK